MSAMNNKKILNGKLRGSSTHWLELPEDGRVTKKKRLAFSCAAEELKLRLMGFKILALGLSLPRPTKTPAHRSVPVATDLVTWKHNVQCQLVVLDVLVGQDAVHTRHCQGL